jgi:hypothetical protein
MGKGTRREQEACEIYEDAGYRTYRPATVQYGENDVFGLFDLIAMRPDSVPRYVQVKSNSARGINQWCRDVRRLVPPEHAHAEFLVCHDREGWRLLRPTSDGYTTVYDEREKDVRMGAGVTEWLSV